MNESIINGTHLLAFILGIGLAIIINIFLDWVIFTPRLQKMYVIGLKQGFEEAVKKILGAAYNEVKSDGVEADTQK